MKHSIDSISNTIDESKPTLVGKSTQVENQNQDGEAHLPLEIDSAIDDSDASEPSDHFKHHARRVVDQDSSVALEARAAEGLERGYTRLPNGVLMQLVQGDYTRNEIKIALIIARFTISFRREFAPLSKGVLERQSGLRGPAILEAVAGLVKKGLVKKQRGDQYRPNMLGLTLQPGWQGLDRPSKKDEESIQSEPDSHGVTSPILNDLSAHPLVGNQNPALVANPTQGEVQNLTSFKDRIYKNNISLSSLPESLRDYFQELKPAKKRESEWKAFEGLRRDYQAADIADCVTLLKSRGIRGARGSENQTCHSPMAYLAKAIGQVLADATRFRELKSLNHERVAHESRQQTEQQQVHALEAQQWAEKEQAFLRTFPSQDQQQAKIAEICRNKPFAPTQRAGRIFAITQWWNALEAQNAQESQTVKVANC